MIGGTRPQKKPKKNEDSKPSQKGKAQIVKDGVQDDDDDDEEEGEERKQRNLDF